MKPVIMLYKSPDAALIMLMKDRKKLELIFNEMINGNIDHVDFKCLFLKMDHHIFRKIRHNPKRKTTYRYIIVHVVMY